MSFRAGDRVISNPRAHDRYDWAPDIEKFPYRNKVYYVVNASNGSVWIKEGLNVQQWDKERFMIAPGANNIKGSRSGGSLV